MKKEIQNYFDNAVQRVRAATGATVDITAEEYDGHCCEIGHCYKYNDGHYKITIDKDFITDNYKHDVEGREWALTIYNNRTLVSCICHEIAHMTYWNHTKRHKELEIELTARVA